MKTAVSIPDDLFADVERLVGRYGVSRSQLYSRALAEFVARHDLETVCDEINRVVDSIEGDQVPFTRKAAGKILRNTEW